MRKDETMNNPPRFPSDSQNWGDQGNGTQNDPYTGQNNPYGDGPRRDNPQMTRNFGRNRHRGSGCYILLMILFIVGVVAVSMIWSFAPGLFTQIQIPGLPNSHTSSVTLPVSANDHPIIIIYSDVSNNSQFVQNDVAPLHIHKGSDQKIQLTATGLSTNQQTYQNSSQVTYKQTTDRAITIIRVGSQYRGTIDIALPASSDINAHTNASSITVDGLSGQMDLNTLNGAITVDNSTSGASSS